MASLEAVQQLTAAGLPPRLIASAVKILRGDDDGSAAGLVDVPAGIVHAGVDAVQFVPAAWTFTLHTARPDLLSDDALLGRIEVLLARQSPPIDSGAVTSTSAATGSGGSDGGGSSGVDPMGDPPTAPGGTAVSAAPAAEGIATAAVGASASERIHRLWPALWSAAVRVNDGNAAAKDGAALGVSLLPTMALPSVRLLHAMTSPSLGLAPVTITKKGGGGSGGEPASVSGCFLWPARSVAEGEAA